MHKNNNTAFFYGLLIIFLIGIEQVKAQHLDKYYSQNDDKFLVEVPLWVPFFKGQLSYGKYNINSNGDKAERDFNKLHNQFGIEFYFVGRFTLKKNNLWLNFDTFSGRINKAISVQWNSSSKKRQIINLNTKATVPRLVLGYSIWSPIEKEHFVIQLIPYIGLRYVSLSLKTDVFDGNQLIDVSPNWFEPVIGVYLPIEYKRFKAEFQMDYGASNQKNSWIISNRYRYRISKLVDVQLGFNFFQVKYSELHLENELHSKIQLLGPTAGIGLRF